MKKGSKKFNNKTYEYLMSCSTKKEANERKRIGKLHGTLIRIVKTKEGYDVYGSWK